MRSLVVVLLAGVIFGFGLAISGLAKPDVVLSFLQLEDFGLALTMASALAVSIPVYQLAPRRLGKPVLGTDFEQYPCGVTMRHIWGGVLFGLGWGVSGVCPGAAVASVGLGNWPIVAALAGMLIGAYLQGTLLGLVSDAPGTATASG